MIWFVGAGPGDPELITVKGRRLLEEADVVVYAGSLVPKAVLTWTREGCELHDSAAMTLGEQVEVMAAGEAAGRKVVRLHTGDPSIYGAIGEQMRALDAHGVSYQIVPGVSSFVAAAAALPVELTSPGISQAVIITRQAGRTPVPDGQDIAGLAAHGATMAIFLSAGDLDGTVADLCRHYPRDTATAIVQRASWPEQVVLRGTLTTIARQAREAGVDRTAMILVGNALRNEGDPSLLYDAGFTHGYRGAEQPGGADVGPAGSDAPAADPAGVAE